jgi:hypothetical protein
MKKYIWKNKDHDQVIEVGGVLGRGPDNRVYLKVSGSSTGIPLDECLELPSSSKPTNTKIRIVRL